MRSRGCRGRHRGPAPRQPGWRRCATAWVHRLAALPCPRCAPVPRQSGALQGGTLDLAGPDVLIVGGRGGGLAGQPLAVGHCGTAGGAQGGGSCCREGIGCTPPWQQQGLLAARSAALQARARMRLAGLAHAGRSAAVAGATALRSPEKMEAPSVVQRARPMDTGVPNCM